jgi:hypothetical protein
VSAFDLSFPVQALQLESRALDLPRGAQLEMSSNPLFQPFRYKSLSLANRVVMAPMTRSRSPNGTPGADVAAYYRRRAEGGVGLIVTEGTTVERPGALNTYTYRSRALWDMVPCFRRDDSVSSRARRWRSISPQSSGNAPARRQ